MAATVAVIVFVEVLSIGAGVAIGRILWADRPLEGPVAPGVALSSLPEEGSPTGRVDEAEQKLEKLDNGLEALTGKLESLIHHPSDDNPTRQSARSMLEMRDSFDTAVMNAYAAINEKYLGEVTRLCEELLDRTDLAEGGGDANAFELEQFKSQVETSMNNLTLLPEGSGPRDICKTIESEVSKICSQIERVKF